MHGGGKSLCSKYNNYYIMPKTEMLQITHSSHNIVVVVALVGVESNGIEESRVGGRGYKLRMSPLHGEFEQVL